MEIGEFTRSEDFGFWKNLFLVTVFFAITPITLGISLFSLFSLKNSNLVNVSPSMSGAQVYASLPSQFPTVDESIGISDARPEIVREYLEKFGSPLTPYADLIVADADKYSIDFRLITAIAQQESNLCKVIPPGSYNCWGWGITSIGTLGFKSYANGIDEVSMGLRKNYLDKGYITINDIMSKYTPQSNGSWANGVTEFMSEMQ